MCAHEDEKDEKKKYRRGKAKKKKVAHERQRIHRKHPNEIKQIA